MLMFPTIDPDADRVLVFDCTKALAPNEVLFGGPTLKSLVCTAGIDVNPMNIVLGPPSYDTGAQKILVPVGNLQNLNGNDYEFEVTSTTTFPPKIVVVRALLQVRAN